VVSHVEIVDQTLRDGQQSLWGLRMRAHQAAPALPHIAKTGFKVVDLTGAGMFAVLLRQFKDDPWAATDRLVAGLQGNVLRAGMRTTTVAGFAPGPDAVMDLWVKTLLRHGIESFWIYDCLYNMETMRRLAEVIVDSGGKAVPSVMYGLTDLHDDAFFAERAREMASWPGIETIYVEDAPGVLTPERAATLLPALQEATGDVPLELHAHNTAGLAPLVYIEGLRHGITILHTASLPMANGTSLPSTEATLDNLAVLGHTHGLDESQLPPVAEHFEREARRSGYELGVPNEFSLRLYEHQLPGGMTGTLKSQLAQHGMTDRLTEVLEEIPRVRRDLGEPIMATPFSQIVGIQAVLNMPDEVVHDTLGHYGQLVREVEPDVADRILERRRAKELAGWERPQPTLAEIRARFPAGISDEELLLRLMHTDAEVDAMLAAGPIPDDPRTAASGIVREVADLIAEAGDARSFSLSRPGMRIALRR
jgi:oxaloacetate decarboxylase (Na+ extruding) subunit alpha